MCAEKLCYNAMFCRIHGGYYIAMRRYENSLLLLKNISTQDKKLNCVQVVMHSSIYYLFIKRLCRTIGEGLGTTELMNLIG